MESWEELRQLMINGAVKFDEGVDKKGKPNHWLIDCREVMLTPRGSFLISKLLYEKFKTFKSNNVGGLITAGIPMVSFIVHLGYQDKNPISGFFIRNEPKKSGLKKLIEGGVNDCTVYDRSYIDGLSGWLRNNPKGDNNRSIADQGNPDRGPIG